MIDLTHAVTRDELHHPAGRDPTRPWCGQEGGEESPREESPREEGPREESLREEGRGQEGPRKEERPEPMNREDVESDIEAADSVLGEYTKQVSSIVRQLAFSGLAFVWLIVAGVGQPKDYDVSKWAVAALIAFALAVAMDAGQYVAIAASWLRLQATLTADATLKGQNGNIPNKRTKDELNANANKWPWVFFFAKVPIAAAGWGFAALAVASAADRL